MADADKDFKVDADALESVADRIQALIDDVNGTGGYFPGSISEFQKAADIGAPLATFWGTKENVFAEAYADEFKGVMTTYQVIATQLASLQQAAITTAQSYRQQEEITAQTMKALGQ